MCGISRREGLVGSQKLNGRRCVGCYKKDMMKTMLMVLAVAVMEKERERATMTVVPWLMWLVQVGGGGMMSRVGSGQSVRSTARIHMQICRLSSDDATLAKFNTYMYISRARHLQGRQRFFARPIHQSARAASFVVFGIVIIATPGAAAGPPGRPGAPLLGRCQGPLHRGHLG
ncbi:hypothetical protein IWX48DRAFT_398164 [Phyllosticta citricarpa]